MESSVSGCPVPFEQQPINQYQELQDSWFFSWATLPWFPYIQKLTWVGIWTLHIAAPVAATSFSPTQYLGQFVLSTAAGISFVLILILLRLYLGWRYIYDRLISPTVFYEESGWYDGQIWQKPETTLTRDSLIATYEVQPILRRLKLSFGLLGLSGCLGVIIWNFLSNNQ